MAEQAMRIALLARAGNARDQLHRALTDLGANLVAEGDPSELDPAHVASLQPALVLISVEPAIEAALDRFDDLLAMPGIDVMYDDAEVTRQLDGWDLNRWARHLAAKLLGSDVLPPAPEGAVSVSAQVAAPLPEPIALVVPALEMAQSLSPASLEMAVEEPMIDLTVSLQEDFAADLPMPSLGLDLDPADVEHAIGLMDAGTEAHGQEAQAGTLAFSGTLQEDFTIDADLGNFDQMIEFESSAPSRPKADTGSDELLADIDFDAQPTGFSHFSSGDDASAVGVDDDVAALAAQLDAFSAGDQRQQPQEPDFSRSLPEALAVDEPAAQARKPESRPEAVTTKQSFDFSSLSLAPMDGESVVVPVAIKPAAPSPTVTTRMNLSLEPTTDEIGAGIPKAAPSFAAAIPEAAPSFSAAIPEAAPSFDTKGAVLILAGLGGPDAVRQLLKALPPRLPVPVLLCQHLEVGNHDRLVSQLAKVSAWPVYLASAGMRAQLGQVAVLPHGIGARLEGTAMVFAPMANQQVMVENLPAGESMVFVLSGANPDAVPAVLAMAGKGGVAMAQDPSTCFDPSAAQALASGGATAGDAGALARRLSTRWA